jgi:hypothetical protein
MARPQVTCTFCNEEFPAGRRSCPHCGADATTGWNDPEDDDLSVELGETSLDDPDYDAFLRREGLGPGSQALARRNLVAALIIAALLLPILWALWFWLGR